MAAGSTGQVGAGTQGSFRDHVHIPFFATPRMYTQRLIPQYRLWQIFI